MYSKHIVESYFLIHYENLCFLIGEFRPLIFKLIIHSVGLIATIFVIIFFFLPCFLSFILFLPFIVLIEHFMIPFSLLSIAVILTFFLF